MPVKTSTGLAQHLAVTGSLKSAFDGGLIKVYGGAVPADADSAEAATPLWVISLNGAGTGLTFSPTPAGRAFVKPVDAVWSGPTIAGTATHFRVVSSGDDGSSSVTARRIQGVVGSVAGSDMYMSNPILVTNEAADAKTLTDFSLTLPIM